MGNYEYQYTCPMNNLLLYEYFYSLGVGVARCVHQIYRLGKQSLVQVSTGIAWSEIEATLSHPLTLSPSISLSSDEDPSESLSVSSWKKKKTRNFETVTQVVGHTIILEATAIFHMHNLTNIQLWLGSTGDLVHCSNQKWHSRRNSKW